VNFLLFVKIDTMHEIIKIKMQNNINIERCSWKIELKYRE